MLGEVISVFDRLVRLKIIAEDEFQKIISRFFTDIKKLHEAG